KVLVFSSHAPEHRKRLDEEMSRPTAGVHDCHFRYQFRPAVERPSYRSSFVVEAQILKFSDEWAFRMPTCPPCTERILEQESNHIVFGEQLGYGPEVGAANLSFGSVYLVLFILLPELIYPAERVISCKYLGRQSGENLL